MPEPIPTKPVTAPRGPYYRLGPAVWLATGAWVGFFPFAPGTLGALWGLPLAWGIAQLPRWELQLAAIAAVVAAGIPVCTAAARRLGTAKDPGCIVLDEIASMPLVFFLIPDMGGQVWGWPIGWLVWPLGFALHRVFDIAKPPPVRQLERLPDGLGIMADDVAAALLANLALRALIWLNGGALG